MSEAASNAAALALSSGVRVLPNGDVYEGEFQGNIPHGHGLLTYYNGSIYSGAFVMGKKHGFGTYVTALLSVRSSLFHISQVSLE
jgi:hypothetical protein